MRGDNRGHGSHGEAARVAARVRALLDAHDVSPVEWSAGDGPRESAPSSFADVGVDEVPDPGRSGRAVRTPAGRPRLIDRWRARVPLRVDPGRRAVLAVGLAVVVAAVATGAWLVAHRPRALAVTPTVPGASALVSDGASVAVGASLPAASASAPGSAPGSVAGRSSAAPPDVVVDVAGKVHRPGLYRLAPGARIDDAVLAAGGALPGVSLTSLNLAAKVVDGQQVLVGLPAPAPGAAPAGGGTGASPSTSGPVDLNTATADQLDELPGVGPVLAQHILDWRTAHGSFTNVNQLDDVPGIGPAKFADLKALVTA